MDFSQLQIKHLVKRNDLTQKLIEVTNNATNPINTTPIRIASERNKKYLLVKNKEGNAGWTMSSIDENKSNISKQDSGTIEKSVYMDDNKNALSNAAFEGPELPKSTLSTDNYEDFEDYASLSSDNLLLDKNAYVEDNESVESVIERFKILESEQLATSSNKLKGLSIDYDDVSSFDTLEPDAFYALWLSRMSSAFQKEYHDHDDMLHKAIYDWDEDELEEQKRSVIKKLGKLKESDGQKADALNFWQKFLKATFEFRRTKSDIDHKNLFDDQQDLEIDLSDNPIDSEEQEYKKVYMKETNYPVQKTARIIKKLKINFGSLILPANIVSSYHTSIPNISLDDKETDAETSDFEEIELPTSSTDVNYTKDNSLAITSLVQTPSTDIDVNKRIQVDELINKDVLVHNMNSIEDPNGMSIENYIDISSGEDNESKNDVSEIDNSDDEIPKQLSEEESEFARFLSELKKKDLDSVQKELNTEVQQLNEQRRREKRDSDSVTQIMISECQKLLQLFGIPYITAPMEAEAQCAELLRLELVDGIVTDDSDVFLFGGSRIYKNMFSQKKYVECYLLQDLEQNMGLNREKLISLAILLGSDYTEGLSGVGVVNAMEILNEFPGEKGLEHFRDWCLEVQNGTSKPGNNESDFKKKFRKKTKNLILPKNFPNRHIWDAYLRPQVDNSKLQFQWAMPDLDDLRNFLMDNFSWSYEKVDETLVPLMKTLAKRQSEKTNQMVLDDFFDFSTDSSYKSHKSTRIQRVVDAWKRGNENHDDESSQQTKRSQESSSNSDNSEKSYHKKRKKQKINNKINNKKLT